MGKTPIKNLRQRRNINLVGVAPSYGAIDNLNYAYETNRNRLSSVTDAAGGVNHSLQYKSGTGSYAYDANGNAKSVPGMDTKTISYNYLNLPEQVTVGSQGTISYLYDAAGNKLKKSAGGVDSYYQGSVLKIDGKEISLTGEGRVVNETGWNYEYDLKDHLGNTRVSFKVDTVRAVPLQYKDYYPFGMEMAQWCTTDASATKYLYNGKEQQDEFGLDWYDYGARFYDPELGRWHSVDPLAESYYSQSPFHFSGNNPIRFLDLNGMNYDEWDYDVDSRKMTWVSDKGGNERQYVNVIKDGKQQGEASVSGDEVFVYRLRDNVLVTNTDKQFNDKTYNSKSNYEYTPTEFKKRDIYLKEKSPITTALSTSEREGKAMPLTYGQEETLYGYTVMRLKMFMSAIDQAWDVMPTPSPSVRRAD